jgi:U2 small nuclear ribonucleoprotein B''
VAKASGLKSTSVATSAVVPDEYLPPNKILFLQNVPEEYDVEALSTIFGRFEGFREVRTVPGRAGIAFVEYDAEQGAISAKENTAGMSLGDKTIKVTYQRQ